MNPQFRVEKEDSDALQAYVVELKDTIYGLEQRIHNLENKVYKGE